MLSMRTFILAVVLVTLLLLALPLVTARTEDVPNTAGDPAAASYNQEQSPYLKNAYDVLSYRSQFGECFDVPIREVAACRSAGQTPVQSNWPPLDECFDVSISELASCRSASQKSAP